MREHQVDPSRILAIAFTNTAAEEMKFRLRREKGGEPEICTLHVLGKSIIRDNYEAAGFSQDLANIWNEEKIGEVIDAEKSRLKMAMEEVRVAIYKFEGRTTGRCYIGQTIDPERREREHRTNSSNAKLRNAIRTGEEQFDFTVIAWVQGWRADEEETNQIRFYRDRAVVNLD